MMPGELHCCAVPAQHGRVVVVTGASDGIGKVAALRFAQAGATVVMVGRNEAKTAAAAKSIMSAVNGRNVSWEIADLSRQHDVRELAERLCARFEKIHVLVNNAGAIFADRKVTSEGLERTFALNHLACFTLSLLLLDRLYKAAQPGEPARIVLVSSRAHTRASLQLDDLQSERSFRAWRAYDNAKLEVLLFMRVLAQRIDASRVVVQAVHPGVVATRFAATGNGRWGRAMRWILNRQSVTPEEGADTMIWLATSPDAALTTGKYWIKRTERAPSKAAQNDANALSVWQQSAALAGIKADALVESAGQ